MIEVRNLSVRAGTWGLTGINFSVPTGQYGVLMGRTGSGKTTILETILGLKSAIAGQVLLLGRDVTALPPSDRRIGYVPQDRALFMTMTVRQHLAFALVVRKWASAKIDARVAELADMLGIASLLDRKPAGLSGGEAQRVALGRALAARPGILILDEPLTGLDDQTRQEIYAALEDVQARTQVTTLHVTHHAEDAARLGDCVWVLKDAQVVSA